MNTSTLSIAMRMKSFDLMHIIRQLGMLALLLVFSGWLTPSSAQSTQPVFALAKNICTGNFAQIIASGSGQNPASCPLATSVVANSDVYYVITVTNPIGEPQQQINLIDALPQGFTQSGAIVCRDDATPTPNTINLSPGTGANSIGSINLAPGATVHCFIQGQYANPTQSTGSTRLNTVNAGNGGANPFSMTASVSTNVLTATPLLADLSVTKTSSGAVNVSSGSALITYTIVIKNNGSVDADLADYFKLNDNLFLPPNGVPLNVEYVGSNCVSTPSTNCLSGSGPNLSGSSPLFVGPSGPTNFFNWGFDPGNGMIKNGGIITLTVVVRVSQVSGMECTQSLTGNGLINQAFFTLAGANGAYSELNPANNTSSVLTPVNTGQSTVDPECGKGHIRIKKVQISPPPGSIVTWGAPVTYAITIENYSLPQQLISIAAGDLRDWITQGQGTPPFTRKHIKTVCMNSTDPALCAAFNPGFAFDPDHNYKYYGETKRAWITSNAIDLAHSHSVTFHTQFAYTDPECDTVPNTQPKRIINTAMLTYTASAYGALNPKPQANIFNIEASATTDMRPRPVCEFLVTKKIASKTPRIQFGVPFSYDITYSNNGLQRTVGTLLDVIRLTIPNYASNLPYTATWVCKPPSGMTGLNSSGTISGNTSYTANPMQGAPAANLGSNIFFPAMSTLTCRIDITLQRPAPNDPFCTQDKAEFENLALMDVTSPFNSNINWPPASTYNPANSSNPTPQNVNWAAVKAQLPACWDATVNKSAKVDGLPATNAPWTYVGGPGINYTITTTNKGQSNLGNPSAPPAKPQWLVEDNFQAPYANSNATAGSPICDLAGSPWCHSAAPMDPKSVIAVKNLAPQANGEWNIKYNGPFTAGNPIKNCANVKPDLGADAGNYYQNSIPSPTPTACVTIPVVEVTEIKVKKELVDNTGANVKAGGPFGFQLSCSPYPLPTGLGSFNLSTSGSGSSTVTTIFPVPRASNCLLTEPTVPIPPSSAQMCGGANNVEVIKEYLDSSGTWKPMNAVLSNLNTQQVGNSITVRNTLRCKPASIQITKVVTGPASITTNINQSYTINASCSPAASPTSVVVFAGAQSGSGSMQGVANAVCNFSEPPPALPQGIKDYCTGIGQTAAWDPVTFSPANPVTLVAGTTSVTVTNKWKCVPPAGTMYHVQKILDPGPGGVQLSGLQFTVQANCSPSPANPTSVTGSSGPSPNGQMIGIVQVPSGSTCTFSEPTLPSFPQAAISQCAPGTPIWNSPTFATSPLVLKVTNSWSCSSSSGGTSTTAQLVITKKVEGPSMPPTVPPPPVTPAQNYQVTANCSKVGAPNLSSVNLNASGNSPASGTITASTGDLCSITESPPTIPPAATAYCNQLYFGNNGNPYSAVWETPVFTPSSSLTLNSGTNNVTVTNKWKCVPPVGNTTTLTVNKIVSKPYYPGNSAPNADTQTYQINASCSSNPVNVGASGSASGSSTVSVTPGANCSFSEPTPSWPPNIVAFCAGKGTPTWKPPVFTPASLTVANGSNTVTVTNSWECAVPPPTGVTLQIKKVVTGPPGAASAPMQAYQISSACTTPVSINASGTGFGSIILSNLTPGASCSFAEATPTIPLALSNYCSSLGGVNSVAVWDAPSISPPSLTLAVGINSVTVTNNWKCVPPAGNTATLTIRKVVTGPAPTVMIPPTAPMQGYQINATCVSGATTVNASGTTNGSTTVNVTPGASCSFSEAAPAMPSVLSTYCSGLGQTATWDPPAISPASLTVANGSNTVTVTNNWKCIAANTGTVKFYKKVDKPTTAAPLLGTLNYSFGAIGATPASVSLSANAISAGYSAPITAAVGTSLTVTETLPTLAGNTAAANFCGTGKTAVWNAPTFAKVISSTPYIEQAVTMPITVALGETRIIVTNTWKCIP